MADSQERPTKAVSDKEATWTREIEGTSSETQGEKKKDNCKFVGAKGKNGGALASGGPSARREERLQYLVRTAFLASVPGEEKSSGKSVEKS